MPDQNILPPFTEIYEAEGAKLALNSGTPIKERVVRDALLRLNPNANLNLMTYAGFWIMEASLVQHELSADKYPSLYYYLEKRNGSLEQRWDLYVNNVQEAELDLLRLAYDATRRNLYETMRDLDPQEKKSA